jgi:hypothetical protein
MRGRGRRGVGPLQQHFVTTRKSGEHLGGAARHQTGSLPDHNFHQGHRGAFIEWRRATARNASQTKTSPNRVAMTVTKVEAPGLAVTSLNLWYEVSYLHYRLDH